MSNHNQLPTPGSRIWSTYQLAFASVAAFVVVAIITGIIFTFLNSPIARSSSVTDPLGGGPDTTAYDANDRVVALGVLPSVLDEGSGVAVDRERGIFWAHNDDAGPAQLIALDTLGVALGAFIVPGVEVSDLEDISLGPCPGEAAAALPASGSASPGTGSSRKCLYLGDIGDNARGRSYYRVHAVVAPEVTRPGSTERPRSRETSLPIEVLGQVTFVYEGRQSRDAEALAVSPTGDILVVTKGQEGRADVFGIHVDDFGTGSGSAEEMLVARHRATLPLDVSDGGLRVTGAAFSPDGRTLAVRTASMVHLFPADDLESEPIECDASGLEYQGEAIDYLDATHLILTGEARGSSPAPLLRVRCP